MATGTPGRRYWVELFDVQTFHLRRLTCDVRPAPAVALELDESDVYYLNSDLLGCTRETVKGEAQRRAIRLAAVVLASAGIRELR